ncbi:MAG: hypothetical protein AAGN66_05450 [Acidobacteriota bacterium]
MLRDLIDSGMSQEGFNWEDGPWPSQFQSDLVAGSRSSLRQTRCRVVFDLGGSASGFLIGDDLLMTNHHVFGTKDDAANATLQFNYEIQEDRTTIGPDQRDCIP